MKVYKCFIDFDREEKWLSEMARQGYELEKASFGYCFHAAEPEDAVIKIDYRILKDQKDFEDYCALFEDSGWKHLAGTRHSGAQYFKKAANCSGDDIFSDQASKAGKFKRLSDMWLGLALIYIPIILVLVSDNYINLKAFLNPKLVYLTPGLWEMSGAEFWRHFLFETPFALMRSFAWILATLPIILYLIFSIKARMLYYRKKKASDFI